MSSAAGTADATIPRPEPLREKREWDLRRVVALTFAALVYFFLYAPILVMAVFSFSSASVPCAGSSRGTSVGRLSLRFLALGYLGTQPVSPASTFFAQFGTLVYFGFFLLMPWWSRLGTFKPVPERVTFAAH